MTAQDDATAVIAAAAALLQRGAFAEAADHAERGLQQAPDSADLWTLLGAARFLGGDLAGSARATARVLVLNPGQADAVRNHALALEGLRAGCRAALVGLGEAGDEGPRLDAAFRAVADADDAGVLDEDLRGAALAVFLRVAATEEADRRWPFAETGRALAARGEHRSLIYQLPRVRDDDDRREALEHHRIWGRAAEARAAARPIRPAPRGPRARLRVALCSSDLRLHVVTAFADPLIEYAPRYGVDLFCYSAQPGPADGAQRHIAGRVAKFTHLPGAEAAALASAVGADAPDVLVEVGGSTNANRLEAWAHRLAPVQVSWLGYPHSSGLSTIDRMVLDPHLLPTDPAFLTERPLVMPRSWIALSPGFFREDPRPASALPQDRKGHVTFGTANSSYKYSPATLDAWARVLRAVPGSRFLFVRPEGGSTAFVRNVAERFARQGVDPGRLAFAPVRGGHLPYYDEIDVSLDTFPLTGGTTTCEALWMGVPVVTLAGPAVYERLSHSILQNAGLGELSTDDLEAFIAKATAVAQDRPLLRAWRAEGRARMTAGALGDMEGFARDFCRLLTGAANDIRSG